MRSVPIDTLGKRVSTLALGTMHLRTANYDWSCRLLDSWVERGGTVLDCARDYGNGESEEVLGRWLAQRGTRHEVTIVTKGGHPDDSGPRVNPDAIIEDLRRSRSALGTEEIDIYLLHRDDESVPVGEIVDCLDMFVRDGLVKVVGVSNWSISRIREANQYAQQTGSARVAVSSPHLSLARQTIAPWPGCISAADDASREFYTEQQITVMPWSSQSSGFFAQTGPLAERARRVYDTPANWERLRRATELARRKDATPNQVALAWVLAMPFPVVPIIGAMTPHEMSDSIAALGIVLTSEEVAWLDLK